MTLDLLIEVRHPGTTRPPVIHRAAYDGTLRGTDRAVRAVAPNVRRVSDRCRGSYAIYHYDRDGVIVAMTVSPDYWDSPGWKEA